MKPNSGKKAHTASARPSSTARRLLRRGLSWIGHPYVRRALTLGLTVLAFASLGVLLYANWDTLRTYNWQIRPWPLLISFLLYTLALALAIFLWGQIMNRLGTPIPWHEHVRVYCVSNLARRIPGPLWHVVGRVILYDPERANKSVIALGSGLELVLTALSSLVVGIVAWPGEASQVLNPLWIAGVVILSLVVIHPKILNVGLRWLGSSQSESFGWDLSYRRVLSWLVLYGLVWILGGLMLFALIQMIYPVPLARLPQTIGAWSLSGMVSVVMAILPVGLGFRELALGLLLTNFLPDGIAILIAILARLLLTLYELIWVLIVTPRKGTFSRLVRR
jgi:uncharacterized membrane protein YbhN (UPF0104 family)